MPALLVEAVAVKAEVTVAGRGSATHHQHIATAEVGDGVAARVHIEDVITAATGEGVIARTTSEGVIKSTAGESDGCTSIG